MTDIVCAPFSPHIPTPAKDLAISLARAPSATFLALPAAIDASYAFCPLAVATSSVVGTVSLPVTCNPHKARST